MNRILKSSMFVQVAALLLLTILAASAQAGERIKISGTVEGSEIQNIDFPKMQVAGTGTANTKQLGQISLITQHDVYLITGVGLGSTILDAGNGNKLYTSIHAVGIPTGVGGEFRVTEYHTILEGTGRFSGATGSFKLVRLIDSTLAWHGIIEGSIRIGKEDKADND